MGLERYSKDVSNIRNDGSIDTFLDAKTDAELAMEKLEEENPRVPVKKQQDTLKTQITAARDECTKKEEYSASLKFYQIRKRLAATKAAKAAKAKYNILVSKLKSISGIGRITTYFNNKREYKRDLKKKCPEQQKLQALKNDIIKQLKNIKLIQDMHKIVKDAKKTITNLSVNPMLDAYLNATLHIINEPKASFINRVQRPPDTLINLARGLQEKTKTTIKNSRPTLADHAKTLHGHLKGTKLYQAIEGVKKKYNNQAIQIPASIANRNLPGNALPAPTR